MAACLDPRGPGGTPPLAVRVLIIEDDDAVRRSLADALTLSGYAVQAARDGRAGLAALGIHPAAAGPAPTATSPAADLVLLDLMLPAVDGFGVLAALRRAAPGLPVIIITARGAEADRIRGLRGGADDYIVKPFGLDELLARVEAVLRRAGPVAPARSAGPAGDGANAASGPITIAGRTLDLRRHEVISPTGERALLTQREAEVLGYLIEHRGRVITREELLERVWGLDPRGVRTRTVDMAVARLREHLGDNASSPAVILTVRGTGYMLAAEAPGATG